MQLPRETLLSEIVYRTSRSSGSGGQHINKVESRVEALLNVPQSHALTDKQKSQVMVRLKNRIDSRGNLSVSCSTSRHQLQNRTMATERLLNLIELALKKKKIRKKTGLPKNIKEKRIRQKKEHSALKSMRRFRPDM